MNPYINANPSFNTASDVLSGHNLSDAFINLIQRGNGSGGLKNQNSVCNYDFREDKQEVLAPVINVKQALQLPFQGKPQNFQNNLKPEQEHGYRQRQTEENLFGATLTRLQHEASTPLKEKDDTWVKLLGFEERLSTASKKISKRSPKSGEKSHSRRAWQPYEDKLLLELFKELGPSWAAISKRMGGARSGKQVRDRYLNKLDPKIKRAEWTDEDDNMLISLYKRLGKKWSEIAKNIPGRTEAMVKNRFQWKFKGLISENSRGASDSNHNDSYDEIEKIFSGDASNMMSEESLHFELDHIDLQRLETDRTKHSFLENKKEIRFEESKSLKRAENDKMHIDFYDTFHHEQSLMNGNASQKDSLKKLERRHSEENLLIPEVSQIEAQPKHVQNNQMVDEREKLASILFGKRSQSFQTQLNSVKSYIQKNHKEANSEGTAVKQIEALEQRLENLEKFLKASLNQLFKSEGADIQLQKKPMPDLN